MRQNYELSCPSDINKLEDVLIEMEEIFKDHGVPEDAMDNVIIASSEIISNAIVHGNKGDKKLPVKILMEIKNNRIEIKVRDYGKGFNRKSVDDPLDNGNLLKTAGRGLLITEHLIDELKHNFLSDGTESILIKNFK